MTRVIVNGTFDILHPGHVALLTYAKSLGDFLIVAIDSDERVKKLKGSDRPINSQEDRKTMLEALKPVDKVVFFNTDQDLIDCITDCSLMVKGSDYRDKPIIGEDIIKVVFYERTNHSTTQTIQNIANRR